MAEEYAVEVENISKIYTLRNKNNQYKTDKKEFYALKGVTFKVKKGRCSRYFRNQWFR